MVNVSNFPCPSDSSSDSSVAGPVAILILPGINDSGPAHWQSLWEATIPGARRVLQDDWDNPDRAAWVAALARAVEEAQNGKSDGTGEGERGGAGVGVVLVAH